MKKLCGKCSMRRIFSKSAVFCKQCEASRLRKYYKFKKKTDKTFLKHRAEITAKYRENLK